jgi:hypothetical protein
MTSFCKNREHEQIVRRLFEDAGGRVTGVSFKGSNHIAMHVQLNRLLGEVIISSSSSDVNARHQVKTRTRRLILQMSAAENARISVGPSSSELRTGPQSRRSGF